MLIMGDLSLTGCLINAVGDYGPFVFVGGSITCQSMLLGGAYALVKGIVEAKEVVMMHYNHGYFKGYEAITSPVVISYDHHNDLPSKINSSFYYNDGINDLDKEDEYGAIPSRLVEHIDNLLTTTFEELLRDLEEGEFVLKGQTRTQRDRDYWYTKVEKNYRDLKRVPPEYKDESLCEKALAESFYAIEYVDPAFITSELCNKLVELDGFAIEVIPEEYITSELCWMAAKKGTMLSCIPKEFYSKELILEVFRNSSYQSDIRDVPEEFISESFVIDYLKIGKGLWLDECCKVHRIDKAEVIKKVIASGIGFMDNIFSYHCSREAFEYAAKLYNNDQYQQEWEGYMKKYKTKLERLKLN
ncbi:hypothetical protein D3C80_1130430 [compost metagenome]